MMIESKSVKTYFPAVSDVIATPGYLSFSLWVFTYTRLCYPFLDRSSTCQYSVRKVYFARNDVVVIFVVPVTAVVI